MYAHYGHELIREVLRTEKDKEFDDEIVDKLFMKIYRGFIEEMDAIDNGVPMFDGAEPKYAITTNLSSRVSHLNAPWYEENTSEKADAGFQKAMQLTGSELFDRIFHYAFSWWPARHIVKTAIEKRFETHESGLIIELERFCPWNDHYFELEEEMKLDPKPLYVLFADSTSGVRVRAIPVTSSSFVLRKALPERFRGIRDDELVVSSGIPTITFVHMSGFIGGAKTREDALRLAVLALEEK